MQQIQVETALGEKLAALQAQVVLVDDRGRALGFFSPLDRATDVKEMRLEPLLSIAETEELRKRARAEPGRPLEEILNELGF
jgi:hypothetical protein